MTLCTDIERAIAKQPSGGITTARFFAVERDRLPVNTPRVVKWLKTLLAIVLLPVCVGAGAALWRVFEASGNAQTIWVATVAGAACWLVIYLLLPKPMWVYVFGHELTHAVWTWAMGGKVSQFKVTSDGGHVVVNKNNFLIALAPYFFPLYAVLVMAAFVVGRLFWNWQPYVALFHLLLGAAYAFHVTLTWHILKGNQSDISDQGYLFSAVVIFLGNAAVLLVGIPLLTGTVRVPEALGWWLQSTEAALRATENVVRHWR